MQQYKSQQNLSIDTKIARRAEKRRGVVSFDLEANQSGRIVVSFTKEYAEVPYIMINTIVNEGSEFEIKTILTTLTQKDFTINIQNSSTDPAKGFIQWIVA